MARLKYSRGGRDARFFYCPKRDLFIVQSSPSYKSSVVLSMVAWGFLFSKDYLVIFAVLWRKHGNAVEFLCKCLYNKR